MRISRIHFGAELVIGDSVTFDKSQSHYLKHVLRLTPGAAILLFNGRDAIDYQAIITADGKLYGAKIESSAAVSTESPLYSEILQALGRSDHMDLMVQKTSELGINRIILFNAERTQSPLKAKQLEKKLAHWQAVAGSACEQCGRAIVPHIEFSKNLEAALPDAAGSLKLLLDFEAPSLAGSLRGADGGISILLGPEGGLSAGEISMAQGSGFEAASLGPRILRTETAAISAVALAQSIIGDLK